MDTPTDVESTCKICEKVFYFCIPQKYCPECKSGQINPTEVLILECPFCGQKKISSKPLQVCPYCKRYYATRIKEKFPDKTCLRCKETWTPKKDIIKMCPRCKSYAWNVPRKPDFKDIPVELQAMYEQWLKDRGEGKEEMEKVEPKELGTKELETVLDSISAPLVPIGKEEEIIEEEEDEDPVELTPEDLMEIWDSIPIPKDESKN